MFKRTYFFSVESLPYLRESRRKEGKVTQCTGFVSIRAFSVDSELLREGILDNVQEYFEELDRDEIMLTQLSKI